MTSNKVDPKKFRVYSGLVFVALIAYIALCVLLLMCVARTHDAGLIAVAAIYVNLCGFVLMFAGDSWARKMARRKPGT